MFEKLKKNPIIHVFSKEYKKEVEILENMKKMIPHIKLKSSDYDINKALEPLIKENYKSNFRVKVGELNETS